jgi:hypothetical protein
MSEFNAKDAAELVNSMSNLAAKIEHFPKELIYLVGGIIVFSFVYLLIKLLSEIYKDTQLNRLVAKNTEIIGACKEAMNNVCAKLENL